jgi:hypothetical protein
MDMKQTAETPPQTFRHEKNQPWDNNTVSQFPIWDTSPEHNPQASEQGIQRFFHQESPTSGSQSYSHSQFLPIYTKNWRSHSVSHHLNESHSKRISRRRQHHESDQLTEHGILRGSCRRGWYHLVETQNIRRILSDLNVEREKINRNEFGGSIRRLFHRRRCLCMFVVLYRSFWSTVRFVFGLVVEIETLHKGLVFGRSWRR